MYVASLPPLPLAPASAPIPGPCIGPALAVAPGPSRPALALFVAAVHPLTVLGAPLPCNRSG